jgi:hypothetical protein
MERHSHSHSHSHSGYPIMGNEDYDVLLQIAIVHAYRDYSKRTTYRGEETGG